MGAPFSPAFLTGEGRARVLLPDDFRDRQTRAAHVHCAGERRVSPQTLEALHAQSAAWPSSPARQKNLEAMAQPGTSAVVTGQQVGLFLGPMYAFYKAASAVAVARALSEETGTSCVPVFWLQSEDHDFEEINHCALLGTDGAVHRLEVSASPERSRRSIHSLPLGPEVALELDEMEAHLAGAPHLPEVMELLRAHYRPESTWVQAFAGVLAELFAEDGLVIFDPRDPNVARQVRRVHERGLVECAEISRRLLEWQARLEEAGFAAQVHVRPGAPLSFFHPDGPEGPRFRLEAKAAHWGLVGRGDELTTAQLLEALERVPLSFSTSALLRPIAQDTLLPTAAIVGGPGEINYLAQLPPLYDFFGLSMPMVVPRARFRVVTPRTRALLEKLGLDSRDLEAPRDELVQRVLPPPSGPTPHELEQRLLGAIDPVLDSVPSSSWPEVADGVKRTRGTIARAVSRLSARYARALARSDQLVLDRVDRLQRTLFPHGEPQERVLCLPSFASRVGWKNFRALVFSRLEPFSTDVKDLMP